MVPPPTMVGGGAGVQRQPSYHQVPPQPQHPQYQVPPPPQQQQQRKQAPPADSADAPQLLQQQQQAPPQYSYQYPAAATSPTGGGGGGYLDSGSDGVRSLWIGDLPHWMDENHLTQCFEHTGEVVSVKVIRNKQTNLSEGYGFIEFVSHAAAERNLLYYNGLMMPGVEQTFRLNWASLASGEKRFDDSPEYTVFVGDLAPDVTDFTLLETFRPFYPSVKGAKVVTDRITGRPKGYGFVKFGDEIEQNRAMTEMNGRYCSSRPMRIGQAANKKTTLGGQSQTPREPMIGKGYQTVSEVYLLAIIEAKRKICDLINEKKCAPLLRRIAFQDPTELNLTGGDGHGADDAVRLLAPIKQQFAIISNVDFYQLASAVASEVTENGTESSSQTSVIGINLGSSGVLACDSYLTSTWNLEVTDRNFEKRIELSERIWLGCSGSSDSINTLRTDLPVIFSGLHPHDMLQVADFVAAYLHNHLRQGEEWRVCLILLGAVDGKMFEMYKIAWNDVDGRYVVTRSGFYETTGSGSWILDNYTRVLGIPNDTSNFEAMSHASYAVQSAIRWDWCSGGKVRVVSIQPEHMQNFEYIWKQSDPSNCRNPYQCGPIRYL